MRIPPEVLEDYLDNHYKGVIDKHSEEEWILPSFENPNKMKLYVNIKKGVGNDFIGGQGYNAFSLIKNLEGLETYEQVLEFLFDTLKFRFDPKSIFKSQVKQDPSPPPPPISEIKLPEGCISIFDKDPVAQAGLQYLVDRGLSKKDIQKYHLKVGTQGQYRRRIIIPFIEDNKIVWYQGRSINPYLNPKYLNPKGVDKKMLVYNIDNIEQMCFITEGPIDAMMVNGVALSASRASDWQVNKIIDKKPDGIVVIPDNDETKVVKTGKILKRVNPGYQGALATIEKLVLSGFPVDQIFVAFIEGGKDLNDIGRKRAFECIRNAKPINVKTLIQFKQKGAAESNLLQSIV